MEGNATSTVWAGKAFWGLPFALRLVAVAVIVALAAACTAAGSVPGAIAVVALGTSQVFVSMFMSLTAHSEGITHARTLIPWSHVTGSDRDWLGTWLRVRPPVPSGQIRVKSSVDRIPLWRYRERAADGTPISTLVERAGTVSPSDLE